MKLIAILVAVGLTATVCYLAGSIAANTRRDAREREDAARDGRLPWEGPPKG